MILIKLGILAVMTAGILSLVFHFSLSNGFHTPPARPNIVHTTITTYPVPPMPSGPVTVAHGPHGAKGHGHPIARRIVMKFLP